MYTETVLTFLSPHNILYLLFALVFVVYWTLTFIIFYHLIRFGVGTTPKKLAVVFLIGSAVIFSVTVLFFFSIDIETLQNQLNLFINNTYQA